MRDSLFPLHMRFHMTSDLPPFLHFLNASASVLVGLYIFHAGIVLCFFDFSPPYVHAYYFGQPVGLLVLALSALALGLSLIFYGSVVVRFRHTTPSLSIATLRVLYVPPMAIYLGLLGSWWLFIRYLPVGEFPALFPLALILCSTLVSACAFRLFFLTRAPTGKRSSSIQ